MIKWNKPAVHLPEQGEQVVVMKGDFFELATYEKTTHSFHLRNGVTWKDHDDFEWMRLIGDRVN